MRPGPFAVLVGVLALTGGAARAADEAPPSPALSIGFADAVRRGASASSVVAVARAPESAVADARWSATALPRPPTLALSGGWRTGTSAGGTEVGASLTQEIALRPLGSARVHVADALRDAVSSDVERARLEGATRAALAWATAAEARAIAALRIESAGQAATLLATTRARVEAGVAHPYERALAQAEVGAAAAAVIDGEGREVEALAELRFTVGLGPDAEVAVAGGLGADDDGLVLDDAAARSVEARHPALLAARASARAAGEDVALVSALHGPTVGVGASYLREGNGDQLALALLALPLPIVDTAAFDAARQRAAASASTAQAERVRVELARDLHLAAHERRHTRELRDALRDGARAPAEEAVRLARAEVDAGARDVTVVLVARQRLISVQESIVRAVADVLRADIHFARARGVLPTGRP